MILLDATVLTNFALVDRLELLAAAVGPLDPATSAEVMAEYDEGVAAGLLARGELSWLRVLTPTAEEALLQHNLRRRLGAGEASCLAIARHRQATLATDDRRARSWALQQGVVVTGTLGVLVTTIRRGLVTMAAADQVLAVMIQRGYYSPVSSLLELQSE